MLNAPEIYFEVATSLADDSSHRSVVGCPRMLIIFSNIYLSDTVMEIRELIGRRSMVIHYHYLAILIGMIRMLQLVKWCFDDAVECQWETLDGHWLLQAT